MATDDVESFNSPYAVSLQTVALRYPEVTESPACVNRSFKARKKSFLFLGEKPDGMLRMMVKLEDPHTVAQAKEIAAANPEGWSVKGPGWVTGNFTDDYAPPVEMVTRWIDESFRLQAPKNLLKEME